MGTPLNWDKRSETNVSQLSGVYCIYIYMFIWTELIEETRRPPGIISGLARTISSPEILFTQLTGC